jgi:hypothetical protein
MLKVARDVGHRATFISSKHRFSANKGTDFCSHLACLLILFSLRAMSLAVISDLISDL